MRVVFHNTFGFGLLINKGNYKSEIYFLGLNYKTIINDYFLILDDEIVNKIMSIKVDTKYVLLDYKKYTISLKDNLFILKYNDLEFNLDLINVEDNLALAYIKAVFTDLRMMQLVFKIRYNSTKDIINLAKPVFSFSEILKVLNNKYSLGDLLVLLESFRNCLEYQKIYIAVIINCHQSFKGYIEDLKSSISFKELIEENIAFYNKNISIYNLDADDFKDKKNNNVSLYILYNLLKKEYKKVFLYINRYLYNKEDTIYLPFLKYYLNYINNIEELEDLKIHNNIYEQVLETIMSKFPYEENISFYNNVLKYVPKITINEYKKLSLEEQLILLENNYNEEYYNYFMAKIKDFLEFDYKETCKVLLELFYHQYIRNFNFNIINNVFLELIVNNFYYKYMIDSSFSNNSLLEIINDNSYNDKALAIINLFNIKFNKTINDIEFSFNVSFSIGDDLYFVLNADLFNEQNKINIMNFFNGEIKTFIYASFIYLFRKYDKNEFLKEYGRLERKRQLKSIYNAIDKFNTIIKEKEVLLVKKDRLVSLECNFTFRDSFSCLALKVKSTNGRAYIVKNHAEFIDCFRNNLTSSYGKSLIFQHNVKNLTDVYAKVVLYLMKVAENFTDYYKEIKLSSIQVFDILNLLKGEYIYRTVNEKVLSYLVSDNNFKYDINISQDGFLNISSAGLEFINLSNDKAIIYDNNRNLLYLLENEDKIFTELMFSLNNSNILLYKERFNREIYNRFSDRFDIPINLKDEFKVVNTVIKAYFDYDNDIVTCDVKYYYDDEEIKENILDYDYNKNVVRFNNYLSNLGFVNNKLTDPNLILAFFMLDFNELKKIAQIYLSENILRKQILAFQPPILKMQYKSNVMSCFLEGSIYSDKELRMIINAMKHKKKYVLLKGDKILTFKEEDLAFGQTLNELGFLANYDIYEKKELPLYQVFKTNYKNLELDSYINQMLSDINNYKNLDYDLPQVNVLLRTYQIEGYKWLRVLNKYKLGGILADDMGLGKTLEVITLLVSLKHEKPSLIVTPKSLIYNWISEFNKFAPNVKVSSIYGLQEERQRIINNLDNNTIYITSYDSLYRDIKLYEDKEFMYLILDEAQAIKNALAGKTKSVKKIKASNRLALTGTPIENNIFELWSIFDFLMPNFFPGINKFSELYKDDTSKLALKIAPFVLRRTKKEVLKDLPNKYETILTVEMSSVEKKIYDSYILQARNVLEKGGKSFDVLYLLTRLRQVCISPALVIEDYNKESSKLNLLKEVVIDYVKNDHKILIFSAFVESLKLIEVILKNEKINYYMLTGDTKAKERLRMASDFNDSNQVKVFLISLKAGGTGLNLIGADTVIHVDPWWNIAAENQASDRAYRIGQINNVEVIRLICNNSIEQRVIELQNLKRDLIDKVINSGDDTLTNLSRDDLNYILN